MYRKIRTLDDLKDLADQKRSVFWDDHGIDEKITPAAIVYRMQAETVHELIRRGLWLYAAKGKPASPWAGKAKPENVSNYVHDPAVERDIGDCGTCLHWRLLPDEEPCKSCLTL